MRETQPSSDHRSVSWRSGWIFVIGVVLSFLVNAATTLVFDGGLWTARGWILMAIISAFALGGAALSMRVDPVGRRSEEPSGGRTLGARTTIEVERASGPVVGGITGGDIAFHTNYGSRDDRRSES